MKRTLIIVAGGSGSRMGAGLPKQFIELNGRAVLMHTLEKMNAIDASMELILVLPGSEMETWEKLCRTHGFNIGHSVTEGGETRFLSVKNGLAKVTDTDLVGVHDGVRPFVSEDAVNACFTAAARDGAAVPVVPIVQSLRKVENGRSMAVNRNEYRAVQTPQCFQAPILKAAFSSTDRTDHTDDASVVEAFGRSITLVEGNPENIKLTTPTDLQWAKLMLNG